MNIQCPKCGIGDSISVTVLASMPLVLLDDEAWWDWDSAEDVGGTDPVYSCYSCNGEWGNVTADYFLVNSRRWSRDGVKPER